MVASLLEPVHIVTHRQVTDAHLVALAIRHGGRLATFDRLALRLAPQGGVVDLIPPGS